MKHSYALLVPTPVEGTEVRGAFKIPEAATFLGCSERTVRRLIDAGRLRVVNLTPELKVVPVSALGELLDGGPHLEDAA